MILLIKRKIFTDNSTIGDLLIDGHWFCYTLEDKVRDVKIKGQTAIPAGTYEVIINMSKRFKVLMPLLLNVYNFTGVRIHAGNKALDSEGCVLVGTTKAVDFIGNSKIAYKNLMKKITGQKLVLTIE